MVSPLRFAYAVLYVADVLETVAFYEAAFGLVRRFVHECSDYAELDTGATVLAFAAFDGVRASRGGESGAPAAAFEITLVTEDVVSAYARATAAGAVSLSPPSATSWGQWVAYVRDPNGVVVELCSPLAG